jgi:cobalt/nickel transport system permease protein
VSGGHAHGLYLHNPSPVHRLHPQCKVAATGLFVLAVIATPRTAVWAFAGYVLSILAVATVAHIPIRFIARRLSFEIPFLLFAFLLPFFAGGDRVPFAGVSLSVEGLWAAWNIAIKASLGLIAAILLGATTSVADVLHGLERLRVPRVLTAIAHFMVRYSDVITGEMKRMRIARESRGYEPRFFWQAKALGSSIAALFIRSYERGERVYVAMVARGFTGSIPVVSDDSPSPTEWSAALLIPAAAVATATLAWVVS